MAHHLVLSARTPSYHPKGVRAPGLDHGRPTADVVMALLSSMPKINLVEIHAGGLWDVHGDDELLPINAPLVLSAMSSLPMPEFRDFEITTSSVAESALIAALSAHRHTLKRVSIVSTDILEGSWRNALHFLRDHMKQLEYVFLEDLRESERENGIFLLGCPLPRSGHRSNRVERPRSPNKDEDGMGIDTYEIRDYKATMQGSLGIAEGFEILFGWERVEEHCQISAT